MDAQMKKGVLELCLLHLIATHETYGYELLGRMQTAFPDVKESTIYAVLRRVQADGLVEGYTGGASSGPARKYLRITQAGRSALAADTQSWLDMVAAVRGLGIL